jgi:hypothetical protein
MARLAGSVGVIDKDTILESYSDGRASADDWN